MHRSGEATAAFLRVSWILAKKKTFTDSETVNDGMLAVEDEVLTDDKVKTSGTSSIKQVDKAVLRIMTDEQMTKYITSYGDRVAVLSFCEQTLCSTNKETLLQRLKAKIGARKMKSKTIRTL